MEHHSAQEEFVLAEVKVLFNSFPIYSNLRILFEFIFITFPYYLFYCNRGFLSVV